jgi:hypothetical protein
MNDLLKLATDAHGGLDSWQRLRAVSVDLSIGEVLGGQAEHIDALGAYLVTGFYTFVRDGRPTTAGYAAAARPSSSRRPPPCPERRGRTLFPGARGAH